MADQNFGIWPVYRVFYLESMRFITTSATNSILELNRNLQLWEEGNHSLLDRSSILNPVQNIVLQGAALSRYFWPVKAQKSLHKNRAEFLRDKFKMTDKSPLKSRDLRNIIEHFDEKLDEYLEHDIAGHIIPEFVGDLSEQREVPVHVFRAYDPTTATFEILGHQFHISPIADEIVRVHVQISD
jgi:hypothetical protein